jgi:hypothetical protein
MIVDIFDEKIRWFTWRFGVKFLFALLKFSAMSYFAYNGRMLAGWIHLPFFFFFFFLSLSFVFNVYVVRTIYRGFKAALFWIGNFFGR